MTYQNIANIAQDGLIQRRVLACAFEQKIDNPLQWVADHQWMLAAQPGWADKWASALQNHAAEPDYQPGSDEAVITDADILAAVQTLNTPA